MTLQSEYLRVPMIRIKLLRISINHLKTVRYRPLDILPKRPVDRGKPTLSSYKTIIERLLIR